MFFGKTWCRSASAKCAYLSSLVGHHRRSDRPTRRGWGDGNFARMLPKPTQAVTDRAASGSAAARNFELRFATVPRTSKSHCDITIKPWCSQFVTEALLTGNRRVLSGIVHALQSGGRWAERGEWEDIFSALAGAGDVPDRLFIDSTCIKVHRTAGGAKGGPYHRPNRGARRFASLPLLATHRTIGTRGSFQILCQDRRQTCGQAQCPDLRAGEAQCTRPTKSARVQRRNPRNVQSAQGLSAVIRRPAE